jgi:hypothetical protein
MAQEIQSVAVYVTFGPFLSTPSDQKPPVSRENLVRAKYVAVRRGYRCAHQRVSPHVVNSRLPKVAARLLLVTPMLVTAEKDDLALIAVRHQSCVHGQNLRINDGGIPRHVQISSEEA